MANETVERVSADDLVAAAKRLADEMGEEEIDYNDREAVQQRWAQSDEAQDRLVALAADWRGGELSELAGEVRRAHGDEEGGPTWVHLLQMAGWHLSFRQLPREERVRQAAEFACREVAGGIPMDFERFTTDEIADATALVPFEARKEARRSHYPVPVESAVQVLQQVAVGAPWEERFR